MKWTKREDGIYHGAGVRSWYLIRRRRRSPKTHEWAVWVNGRRFVWSYNTLKAAKGAAEELELYEITSRTLDRLAALEDETGVADVLREEGVTAALFEELDERPGGWGYKRGGREWHWKLRRWRNTNFDPEVFA